jgi:CRISPR-associated protein Csb1
MSEPRPLDLDALSHAVREAVAVRAVLTLQPAGGKGAKVFPSTYAPAEDRKDEGRFGETKYATEQRLVDGRAVDCVLLDSVASQANRMEQALRDAWEDGLVEFPLLRVDFGAAELPEPVGAISALDAPHRVYDAIFRDSVDGQGTLFPFTAAGKAVSAATVRDAGALYQYCPTALVFGAWDSTGPKGGLGSKFPRAICGEIVAIDVQRGTRVQSRIDPLQITKVDGVVFKGAKSSEWTTEPVGKGAKAVAPSEVNHGNVTPSRDVKNGGVTFDHARQTTVLSLPALRRLRFPRRPDGQPHGDRPAAEQAARTALAALALAGVVYSHHQGHDLRSGTLLVGEGPLTFEIVGPTGETSRWTLDPRAAADLLRAAARRAADHGMAWEREPLTGLVPAAKLVHLLRQSQLQQATKGAADDGAA